MKTCLIFFSLLFTFSFHNGFSQKEYLDEVFKIVEHYSIKRDSVDFKKIKADAFSKLYDGEPIEACYPIVRSILRELNDHHSFFMHKEQVKAWKTTSKTKRNDEVPFSGKLLKKRVGYIHLNGFSSGDSVSIVDYANNLQTLIKAIDNRKIRGWILDLRENGGGNCWPMLAGLGPLLDNGICGYFIDNNHNKSAWYYKDGRAGVNSSDFVKVSIQPYSLLKNGNRIAVLTGPRTTSSGEVIVTAFREKMNCKSFGESTGGYSTGNATFELSDGSMLFLTTSVYADRKENIYGKEIIPDNYVTFSYMDLGKEGDRVIKSAIQWIYKK
jgi:carboxyl-terminal processing protease